MKSIGTINQEYMYDHTHENKNQFQPDWHNS